MPTPDTTFADCRACSLAALRRAGRAVTRHYEAAFRGSGLRATQFNLLSALAIGGPTTMSKLASRIGVERTTLTRNLRPLEANGWVTTTSDAAGDQRLRRVELTAKGRSVAARALPAWRRAQADVAELLERFGVRLTEPKTKT